MTVDATARRLEVEPSELLNTIAVGLEFLGPDALEVHGDIRGRGFVARRERADTRDWRIRLSAPQQVSREPDSALVSGEMAESLAAATERIAATDAENAMLRAALRDSEAEARREREARIHLEGRVAALEEQWAQLHAMLERALGVAGGRRTD